jgi:hypothetical protein
MVFSYLYCGCRSPQDIIRCFTGTFTVIDEDGDGSGPSYLYLMLNRASFFLLFTLLGHLFLLYFTCFSLACSFQVFPFHSHIMFVTCCIF